jgi:hypothetical protein
MLSNHIRDWATYWNAMVELVTFVRAGWRGNASHLSAVA